MELMTFAKALIIITILAKADYLGLFSLNILVSSFDAFHHTVVASIEQTMGLILFIV